MRMWIALGAFSALVAVLLVATLVRGTKESAAPVTLPPVAANELRAAEAFAAIEDDQARAIALFEEAGKVLQSPRCLNCHPAGDSPTQSDAMKPHEPLVVRAADDHGAPALECSTCHHDANFEPAGVPGHPHWKLAPIEMAWQGKTLGEICAQIKDPARNGGRDMDALIRHMAEDSLVGWGWHPGGQRTPAPGTQAAFGALIRAWAASGAACPQ